MLDLGEIWWPSQYPQWLFSTHFLQHHISRWQLQSDDAASFPWSLEQVLLCCCGPVHPDNECSTDCTMFWPCVKREWEEQSVTWTQQKLVVDYCSKSSLNIKSRDQILPKSSIERMWLGALSLLILKAPWSIDKVCYWFASNVIM